MNSEVFDAVIVGAGPIGIELAVRLKQAKLRYAHFDARQVGYTISWFPPLTHFFSSNERIAIAGVPLQTATQEKATREEYLAYLRSIVLQFDLKIHTYEPVTSIARQADGAFALTTRPRGGQTRMMRAKNVILCTGGTDRPRRLGIPGENLPHVSSYFQDPHAYFQQNTLIIGGKNSAVESALRCHHAGARVTISYRRERLPQKSIKYWLMPEIEGLNESKRIAVHFSTVPVAITPTHVTLRRQNDTFDVPADFVLSLIGYEQDNALLKQVGVELHGESQTPRFDPQTMQTNIPGIYVAGTAVGGTQDRYTVFIENCHVHVDRIVSAVTGRHTIIDAATYSEPES
ncbi:MAG TPA: NAD(P)-binding domain-containing protein [Tepidisphaeraceae bacterium]|nr:NAD(P)-binding domain-containing protein [Tepidisphaeraceae bacterium]